MREAPKDGTAVHLRLEYPDGPAEIPGAWRWLKLGAWPPRWTRVSDGIEMHIRPHSFRLAEQEKSPTTEAIGDQVQATLF